VDFDLTDEQQMLRDMVRELCERDIAPLAAHTDKAQEFPRKQFEALAAADLLGIPFPEQYGGMGGSYLDYVIALEEVCRACASTGVTMSVQISLASNPLFKFGTEEQKQKFLAPLCRGEKIGAYSLSEANSGTDAAALECQARREGDEYVINGTKLWVTNGFYADTYIVYVTLNPALKHKGITALVVEKGTPGFTFGKKEDKLGIRGSATYELIFKDCRVPVGNRLGEEGEGFKIAMWTLDGGRIGISAQAIGIAQAALDASIKFAQERMTFGKSLAEHQAIQFTLAEMATDIEAARLLCWRAASLKDRGEDHIQAASMSKLFASEASMWITTKAVQLHGGYGYVSEFPVERLMRDAKITEIYEGTSEAQRMVISRAELAAK